MKAACILANLILSLGAGAACAASFGTVIPIGGHAADLALDERRGVVYVANLTANRIEVISIASQSVQSAINVAWQPGSIALSPDARYLVVTHYWSFQNPSPNIVTLVDLDGNVWQTITVGAVPLAAAFGSDGQALILTTQDFRLLDPATGRLDILGTIEAIAKLLPVPFATFPPEITQASMASSGNREVICGLAEAKDDTALQFAYHVRTREITARYVKASPPLGPRVVSVNQEGTAWLAGWGLFNARGALMAQFRNVTGSYRMGSHAIDSAKGVVYAQIPEQASSSSSAQAPSSGQTAPAPAAQEPVLMIMDADNLAIRERLRLPENLAGKAAFNTNHDVLYAVSDSGLIILPVGSLARYPRVKAAEEAVVLRGSFCERRVLTRDLEIVDPGGGATEFRVSTSTPGVSLSPASGVTPARVRITVDPNAHQNLRGTSATTIEIQSSAAVNIPPPVRLLINIREPDQRGVFYSVPGKLVDILADPVRDRFYILRQDKNQVLVFDGSTYSQIATLRTGNTPTQMAITADGQLLLVGNDDSQIANAYDLERLEQADPIVFPPGHYPRSIAASSAAILAASRVAGPSHTIDQVNMFTRTAIELPSLGVYENKIHLNTTLLATPSGSMIMAAMADGRMMLYNAGATTFTVARKDFEALAGAYGASNNDRFLVDRTLFNPSLVPVKTLPLDTGSSSGFAFVDQYGVRTTAMAAPNPGVIERLDLERAASIRPTRMVEAPLLGEPGAVFTRTLAPLANRKAIVSLTTSGFTVCPWNYDEALPTPRLERVVSAADGSAAVAPGALIKVLGADLGSADVTAQELPVPTALAESCLMVNGALAPIFAVSGSGISAQLPYNAGGNASMVLRTPGGVSNSLLLAIPAAAPSVFRTGTAGPETGLATVLRARNNELVTLANPIHRGDPIVIYATGMGRTWPAIEAGFAAPFDPLAWVEIPPQVELGGVSLPILFAGLSPGQVGVYQVNVLVPDWVPLGMSVPLTIAQGGRSTTLAVRVVD